MFIDAALIVKYWIVATPLRTGGARWAARDHPARGAFLLQLRVPVLELWLSHLHQQIQNHCTLAVQNPMHPPIVSYVRRNSDGLCHPTMITIDWYNWNNAFMNNVQA
jgi:hypothetical protein